MTFSNNYVSHYLTELWSFGAYLMLIWCFFDAYSMIIWLLLWLFKNCSVCLLCVWFHYFKLLWWGCLCASILIMRMLICKHPHIAWRLGPLPLAEKRCWLSWAMRSAGWYWHERQDRGWWWWVASAAARRLWYAHWDRLPLLRCATVQCKGFWKWSLPTYLLLAWK